MEQISVEISYYPLNEAYIEPIKDFIRRLSAYEKLFVRKNGMSTHVAGPYDQVFDALKTEIKKSMELPHSVFVMKILNGDLRDNE
jgi:uncharacterized protein YqgV (UPF0045/DUF77 family)